MCVCVCVCVCVGVGVGGWVGGWGGGGVCVGVFSHQRTSLDSTYLLAQCNVVCCR